MGEMSGHNNATGARLAWKRLSAPCSQRSDKKNIQKEKQTLVVIFTQGTNDKLTLVMQLKVYVSVQ